MWATCSLPFPWLAAAYPKPMKERPDFNAGRVVVHTPIAERPAGRADVDKKPRAAPLAHCNVAVDLHLSQLPHLVSRQQAAKAGVLPLDLRKMLAQQRAALAMQAGYPEVANAAA